MKSKLSFSYVLLALVMIIGALKSANAIESPKYKFNKEIQITVTTVTGNYFKSYQGLVNKPLAQLIEVPFQQPLRKLKKNNSNFFELAMHVQDKVHYYIAVVDDLLNDDQQNVTGRETSSFAEFINLF